MLERMDDFFTARVDGYDEHMRQYVEEDSKFYAYTASLLPKEEGAEVLDLGCGTGLELEAYFDINPAAKVTGIDLSPEMLNALREKFPHKEMNLILGSYFDVPFGENEFDCAMSVESLHHFSKEEKVPLYKKLRAALKDGGYFILTDYFAASEDQEDALRQELLKIRKEQNLSENEFYHYDTPLTIEHEMEAFLEAGFSSVKVLNHWLNTYTIKAVK